VPLIYYLLIDEYLNVLIDLLIMYSMCSSSLVSKYQIGLLTIYYLLNVVIHYCAYEEQECVVQSSTCAVNILGLGAIISFFGKTKISSLLMLLWLYFSKVI